MSNEQINQNHNSQKLSDVFTKEEFIQIIVRNIWPHMVVHKIDPTSDAWLEESVGTMIRYPFFGKSVSFHTMLPVTDEIIKELGNPKDIKEALYDQFVDIVAKRYDRIACIEHGYMDGDPNHF